MGSFQVVSTSKQIFSSTAFSSFMSKAPLRARCRNWRRIQEKLWSPSVIPKREEGFSSFHRSKTLIGLLGERFRASTTAGSDFPRRLLNISHTVRAQLKFKLKNLSSVSTSSRDGRYRIQEYDFEHNKLLSKKILQIQSSRFWKNLNNFFLIEIFLERVKSRSWVWRNPEFSFFLKIVSALVQNLYICTFSRNYF